MIDQATAEKLLYLGIVLIVAAIAGGGLDAAGVIKILHPFPNAVKIRMTRPLSQKADIGYEESLSAAQRIQTDDSKLRPGTFNLTPVGDPVPQETHPERTRQRPHDSGKRARHRAVSPRFAYSSICGRSAATTTIRVIPCTGSSRRQRASP